MEDTTKEKETKLTPKQEEIKGILERIKILFSKKDKNVTAIRIKKGSQTFWVRDPKKIKFWKTMAENSAGLSFGQDKNPEVKLVGIKYG